MFVSADSTESASAEVVNIRAVKPAGKLTCSGTRLHISDPCHSLSNIQQSRLGCRVQCRSGQWCAYMVCEEADAYYEHMASRIVFVHDSLCLLDSTTVRSALQQLAEAGENLAGTPFCGHASSRVCVDSGLFCVVDSDMYPTDHGSTGSVDDEQSFFGCAAKISAEVWGDNLPPVRAMARVRSPDDGRAVYGEAAIASDARGLVFQTPMGDGWYGCDFYFSTGNSATLVSVLL